ncbi:ABC transporter ATP-binding protein [Mycolicibacterium sp. GF69]|uniref:ABC transporter ATP-binding protein n=1 Tax=Mycolicibacterium sp. GF69 TaxID=2267251 RepID=UPI000DCEEBE1|nr:ABC transporter ATP-binding protein [Mycolicibacterium sp. GF69]RAV12751.1 ABC transporter ATP-binding protein [Mycolicibacterium sp. GF69]
MIRGFLQILGPQRGRMFSFLSVVTVYGILHGLVMLLLVPVTASMFDGDFAATARWLGLMAATVLVASVLNYIAAKLAIRMALTTMRLLHHRLGDHMVTLPLGWFSRETVGKVSQIAVKGTVFVGTSGGNLVTPMVVNTVSAVTVVVGLFVFDWRIGLVALVGGALLVVCGRFASGLIAAAEVRTHDAATDVNNRVIEFARYQPVLRAFGRTGADYKPLGDALETQHRAGRAALWQSVAGLMLNGVAVQAVFSVLIGAGVWIAVQGDINPITLVAILGLAARFASPLSQLAELGSAIRLATAELERITTILDTPSLSEPAVAGAVATPGRVELDRVGFGYSDRAVLSEVSFVAEPGSMTALVGPSGSGKSTITKLIARFYDVDAGVVRVGGTDVRDQLTADLMAQLSLVFQDVYLFDDTLWENIRIGRADATDEDIVEAARTAGLLSVVERLPKGWQTQVGEGGSALSGGERQRVSIARALVKDAPVVLFDEATSALDPENEHHVAEAIRVLARRSTVIVIAHKLSTVTAADNIVVLSADGTVEDQGSHADLMKRGGQYAQFWNQRVAASGWVMAARD